jgi:hypothetical protein
MLRSLFDHLQAEYTILVFGNYYTNNGSIAPDSIFIIVYYMLLGLTVCFNPLLSASCTDTVKLLEA